MHFFVAQSASVFKLLTLTKTFGKVLRTIHTYLRNSSKVLLNTLFKEDTYEKKKLEDKVLLEHFSPDQFSIAYSKTS